LEVRSNEIVGHLVFSPLMAEHRCRLQTGALTAIHRIRVAASIVLNNGEQEIERELALPADALHVALMMLARRGRLEIGDVLKVEAPS
jgi:hypothetical protein